MRLPVWLREVRRYRIDLCARVHIELDWCEEFMNGSRCRGFGKAGFLIAPCFGRNHRIFSLIFFLRELFLKKKPEQEVFWLRRPKSSFSFVKSTFLRACAVMRPPMWTTKTTAVLSWLHPLYKWSHRGLHSGLKELENRLAQNLTLPVLCQIVRLCFLFVFRLNEICFWYRVLYPRRNSFCHSMSRCRGVLDFWWFILLVGTCLPTH